MASAAEVSARDVGEEVLSHFWNLSSSDEDARRAAVVGLLEEVLKLLQQAPPVPMGTDGTSSPSLDACHPALVYVVRRLVKGLASGRQASRQGFAGALAALLSRVPGLPTGAVLDLIDKLLDPGSSAKGTDGSEALMGRLFGYGAVVRAGRTADVGTAARVSNSLAGVLRRKSFLREAAAETLLALLEALPPETLSQVLSRAGQVQELLRATPDQASPEVLWLVLRLWGRVDASTAATWPLLPKLATPPPPDFFTSAPPQAGGPREPLPCAGALFMREHLGTLAQVLRASSGCQPRLHSVWRTLLALLLPGFTPAKEAAEVGARGRTGDGQFEALWRTIVEGELLHSSPDRKHLAFTLSLLMLPYLGPVQVDVMLSGAFLRCVTNNAGDKGAMLHAAAHRLLERLAAFSERAERGEVRVAVAAALQLRGSGGRAPEAKLLAATSKRLFQGMDASDVEAYLQQLQAQFIEPGVVEGDLAVQSSTDVQQKSKSANEDSEADEDGPTGTLKPDPVDRVRAGLVYRMGTAAGLPGAPPGAVAGLARFLAAAAFLDVRPSSKKAKKIPELAAVAGASPPLSPASRQACAAKLLSLLDAHAPRPRPPAAALTGNKRPRADADPGPTAEGPADPGGAGGAFSGNAEDGGSEGRASVGDVCAFLARAEGLKGVKYAAEHSKTLSSALQTLRDIEEAAQAAAGPSGGHGEAGKGAGCSGEAGGTGKAVQNLARWMTLYFMADPEGCEPDLAAELKRIYCDSIEQAEVQIPEGEPGYMERLMDVVLALLAWAPSGLPGGPLRSAVEGAFRAFAPRLTPTGMRDLVEVVTGRGDAMFDSDEGEGEEEEDEEDEEEEDEEEDEEEEMKEGDDGRKSAGAKREGKGGEKMEVEEEEEEEEEEAMDDDAMFALDKAVGAVLRARQEAKAGKKQAQKAAEALKERAVGLLEVYARSHAPNAALIAASLGPLLRAVQAGHAPGRANPDRLRNVIAHRLLKCKAEYPRGYPATAEEVAGQLAEVRRIACRHALGGCSASCLSWLLRLASSSHAGGGHVEAAQAAMTAALDDFAKNKKSVLPLRFFQDLARHRPAVTAPLLSHLAELAAKPRSAFKRAELLSLLASWTACPAGDELRLAPDEVAKIVEAAEAAVQADYAKAHHRAEAMGHLAALLGAVERRSGSPGIGGLAGILGTASTQRLLQAVTSAGSRDNPPKVEQQLARIEALLTGTAKPGQAGGKGKKVARAGVTAGGGVELTTGRKSGHEQGRRKKRRKGATGDGGS